MKHGGSRAPHVVLAVLFSHRLKDRAVIKELRWRLVPHIEHAYYLSGLVRV